MRIIDETHIWHNSPRYLETRLDAEMEKKAKPDSDATALASSVLPVPATSSHGPPRQQRAARVVGYGPSTCLVVRRAGLLWVVIEGR